MTTPALAFNVQGRGRNYPWPPQPVDGLPSRRYGTTDVVRPDDLPPTLTPLPSVTNVTSLLAKNGLLGWAAEDSLRSLYSAGLIPLDVEQAVNDHKWAHNRTKNTRAAAGTRAHTLADRLTRDLPLPSDISDEDEAFADAYLAFWADCDPTPLAVEATVYNPDVGYAGTADLFAVIDGATVVLDYKTRREAPDESKVRRYGLLYDENKLQLAALAHAGLQAVFTDGWGTVPAPQVEAGWGVVLCPDGSYHVEVLGLVDLERWFDCFQGLLRAWRALKGVVGVAA